MNIIRSIKRVVRVATRRKKYIILAGVTTCLLASGAAFAYHEHQSSHQANIKPTPSLTPTESAKTPQTKTTEPVAAENPAETKPADVPTAPQPAAPSPQPAAQKQQKPAPQYQPSYPPPSTEIRFSAGGIDTAYTSCMDGILHYTVSSTYVGVSAVTTQSFTWRIEVSDGTISDSGTDTMPSGSSIWHSFPSTPTYPSSLGTIVGANDGDRVRLVITSPNYSAGAWSAPVPAGSEAQCVSGQM